MSELNLQDIYTEILLRKPVEVFGVSRKQYDNLRTSLLRKFRITKQSFAQYGFSSPYYEDYLQCSYNAEKFAATFQLASRDARKTQPNKWKIGNY